MYYGGAIYAMGGVLCVMTVYGVLWRYTVCYGSVLCAMAIVFIPPQRREPNRTQYKHIN